MSGAGRRIGFGSDLRSFLLSGCAAAAAAWRAASAEEYLSLLAPLAARPWKPVAHGSAAAGDEREERLDRLAELPCLPGRSRGARGGRGAQSQGLGEAPLALLAPGALYGGETLGRFALPELGRRLGRAGHAIGVLRNHGGRGVRGGRAGDRAPAVSLAGRTTLAELAGFVADAEIGERSGCGRHAPTSAQSRGRRRDGSARLVDPVGLRVTDLTSPTRASLRCACPGEVGLKAACRQCTWCRVLLLDRP